MPLGVRLKLKIRRVVQKLRRGKLTGKDISIQNALQIKAGDGHAIGQAVLGLQTAFQLPNAEELAPCRLLALPVELLLQILELLWEPGPLNSSEHPYSLPSLRLTCKVLCHLATPLMYRIVNLDVAPGGTADNFESDLERCLTRSQNLSHQIPTIGHLIQEVSIRILPHFWRRASEMDMATRDILSGTSQLQTLTITYGKYDFDASFHSPLLDVIPHLSAVTSITFREADPPKLGPFSDVVFESCSKHVVGHFLAAMLTHHGRNLRSINLFGTLKIDRSLFVQLRDHTPNLQTLGLRRTLSLELSPLFREPKLWSCAAILQTLIVIQCGIHSEYLATQLALGMFSSIRHCSLFACGDPTDNQNLQTTATWRGPTLDTFRVDHFLGWEVDSLAIIPTRTLILTRVERRHLINLMWKPSAFPQVAQLRISNSWSVEELDDLRRAAASRGAEVVTDWDRHEDPGEGDFMLLERCPCVACTKGTVGL